MRGASISGPGPNVLAQHRGDERRPPPHRRRGPSALRRPPSALRPPPSALRAPPNQPSAAETDGCVLLPSPPVPPTDRLAGWAPLAKDLPAGSKGLGAVPGALVQTVSCGPIRAECRSVPTPLPVTGYRGCPRRRLPKSSIDRHSATVQQHASIVALGNSEAEAVRLVWCASASRPAYPHLLSRLVERPLQADRTAEHVTWGLGRQSSASRGRTIANKAEHGVTWLRSQRL